MTISRLTRERLYEDEAIFNKLLPYARWDEDNQLFIHTDGSIWSMWELNPQWITSTSDSHAYQLCNAMQEMLDSLDSSISVQINWVTTFDVEDQLEKNLNEYPSGGIAGWMAKRWSRSIRKAATSGPYGRRPRRLRLIISFRYDPPWRAANILEKLKRHFRVLVSGNLGVAADVRRTEYKEYANNFRGVIEGSVAKLADLGFAPRRVDGQGLINLLFPLLNRRSVKAGKFRRGRNTCLPVPVYDPEDLLSNQVSETSVEHPRNGIVKKDGRVYRSVSMVKPPKQCLPLMITPLQAFPY